MIYVRIDLLPKGDNDYDHAKDVICGLIHNSELILIIVIILIIHLFR